MHSGEQTWGRKSAAGFPDFATYHSHLGRLNVHVQATHWSSCIKPFGNETQASAVLFFKVMWFQTF